jgi:hypothetical protein
MWTVRVQQFSILAWEYLSVECGFIQHVGGGIGFSSEIETIVRRKEQCYNSEVLPPTQVE